MKLSEVVLQLWVQTFDTKKSFFFRIWIDRVKSKQLV